MRTYSEIEALELAAHDNDCQARQELALCMVDEWLQVKGLHALKAIYVSLYKNLSVELDVFGNSSLKLHIDQFRQKPGIATLQTSLLGLSRQAASIDEKLPLIVRKAINTAFTKNSKDILIILDKVFGKDLANEPRQFTDKLVKEHSFNAFAQFIQQFSNWIKNRDLRDEAIELLLDNARANYQPSITLLSVRFGLNPIRVSRKVLENSILGYEYSIKLRWL